MFSVSSTARAHHCTLERPHVLAAAASAPRPRLARSHEQAETVKVVMLHACSALNQGAAPGTVIGHVRYDDAAWAGNRTPPMKARCAHLRNVLDGLLFGAEMKREAHVTLPLSPARPAAKHLSRYHHVLRSCAKNEHPFEHRCNLFIVSFWVSRVCAYPCALARLNRKLVNPSRRGFTHLT